MVLRRNGSSTKGRWASTPTLPASGNLGASSAIASHDLSYVVDPSTGSYVNAYVSTLTILQPDGKLLIYKVNENGIVRYNSDGTIDSTFQTGAVRFGNGPSTNTLTKIQLQSDGKILVLSVDPSGQFDAMQRLNPDGTPDTTFANGQAIYSGTSPAVPNYYGTSAPVDQNLVNLFASGSNFTTMPDGSILVGTYGGYWNAGAIVKITPNGGTASAYDVQAAATDLAAAQAARQAADIATATAVRSAYDAQQAAGQAASAAAQLAQNIADSPITNEDGSISTYSADGGESTVYPDGTTSVSYADGTSVTTYPDGSSDTVNPDGSMTSIDASGQTDPTATDPSSDPLGGAGLVRNGADTSSIKTRNDLLDPNAANLLESNGAGELNQ